MYMHKGFKTTDLLNLRSRTEAARRPTPIRPTLKGVRLKTGRWGKNETKPTGSPAQSGGRCKNRNHLGSARTTQGSRGHPGQATASLMRVYLSQIRIYNHRPRQRR
ncbi:hypothetical protein AVEN_36437-1 [Araneus ventricosus]|uniref:Uncharacterized protein n=1 Tax=Araneus ventricosus TaxID=182803 RepID=A0A4Y2J7F4_ARAVE|nr:hypothetical protein AVEN_36437-1 [Araneus ventricosus]